MFHSSARTLAPGLSRIWIWSQPCQRGDDILVTGFRQCQSTSASGVMEKEKIFLFAFWRRRRYMVTFLSHPKANMLPRAHEEPSNTNTVCTVCVYIDNGTWFLKNGSGHKICCFSCCSQASSSSTPGYWMEKMHPEGLMSWFHMQHALTRTEKCLYCIYQ